MHTANSLRGGVGCWCISLEKRFSFLFLRPFDLRQTGGRDEKREKEEGEAEDEGEEREGGEGKHTRVIEKTERSNDRVVERQSG